MGKGQAFLHNKFFHPSSKENLKRKWVAQQREKERLDRIRARQRQLQLDRESQNSKNGNSDVDELAFMYNAPPGHKESLSKERSKIEQEKRNVEWQEALSKLTPFERRLAEKEREKGLTIHERNALRFDCLKNAPMTGNYVKNIDVNHKPLGKVLKHIKCIKCGQWGHKIYDRQCPLSRFNNLFGVINDNDNHDQDDNDKPHSQSQSQSGAPLQSRVTIDAVDKDKYDPLASVNMNRYSNSNSNSNGDGRKDDFTFNTSKEEKKNANYFRLKNNGVNDGTKLGLLINENENENCDSDDCDADYNDTLRFAESLSSKQRLKILKQLKKREKIQNIEMEIERRN